MPDTDALDQMEKPALIAQLRAANARVKEMERAICQCEAAAAKRVQFGFSEAEGAPHATGYARGYKAAAEAVRVDICDIARAALEKNDG